MAYDPAYDEEDDILAPSEQEMPSLSSSLDKYRSLKKKQDEDQANKDLEAETSEESDDLLAQAPPAPVAPVAPVAANPLPVPTDDNLVDLQADTEEQAASPAPSAPAAPKDNYQALLDQRQHQLRTLALLRASQGIGQAFVGGRTGNFKTDESGVDALTKLANQPVEDYTLHQKAEKEEFGLKGQRSEYDPNSTKSAAYRAYATSKGIKVPDDASANDVAQLLKTMPKGASDHWVAKPLINKKTNEKILGKVNAATGAFTDMSGNPLDNSWIVTGLDKALKDPGTGEYINYSGAVGKTGSSLTGPKKSIQEEVGENGATPEITPSEVYNALDKESRNRLDKEYRPAFNKETEKVQQRLTHVPVIMARLQEAQKNPAALAQLKAEITRFDVGDNRLAQQEFDMFAKRHGYKGWEDWAADKTAGTITADFAKDMAHTVQSTGNELQKEINKVAEKQAKLLQQRVPKEQQVPIEKIAPLIYGNYVKSEADKVKMLQDNGKVVYVPKDKVDLAIKKYHYKVSE